MKDGATAQEHLDGLSDAELVSALKIAKEDLAKAAATQRNSEWHESCFAAVYLFADEMGKRGLKAETVH
jgi:hypothetical protein